MQRNENRQGSKIAAASRTKQAGQPANNNASGKQNREEETDESYDEQEAASHFSADAEDHDETNYDDSTEQDTRYTSLSGRRGFGGRSNMGSQGNNELSSFTGQQRGGNRSAGRGGMSAAGNQQRGGNGFTGQGEDYARHTYGKGSIYGNSESDHMGGSKGQSTKGSGGAADSWGTPSSNRGQKGNSEKSPKKEGGSSNAKKK